MSYQPTPGADLPLWTRPVHTPQEHTATRKGMFWTLLLGAALAYGYGEMEAALLPADSEARTEERTARKGMEMAQVLPTE